LGRTYFKLGKPNVKNSGVSEKLCLAGLITGSSTAGGWKHKEQPDFYLLKGMLESLFAELGLEQAITFQATAEVNYLHPGKAAKILLGTDNPKEIGALGELHPQVQANLKFRHPVYVFELSVEAIYKALKQNKVMLQAQEVSAYPAIRRDMAFLAATAISHQSVLDVLQKAKQPLLRQIELFDEYRSEQLGADQRSLAYRLTFQSDEATLTDAEVDQSLAQLKEALTQDLQVKFR